METDALMQVNADNAIVSKEEWTKQLPDTAEGCYALIRSQACQLEMVNALTYWRMGGVAQHMEADLNIEDAIVALARETGSSDRMLRYCRVTYTAFEHEDLQILCSKGMQWSTIRELAADVIDPFRDKLVKLFLEDRITDLEVRAFVAKIKGGTPLSALIDDAGDSVPQGEGDGDEDKPGDLNKRFEKLRKSMLKHGKAFTADAAEFAEKLTGELSDVLFNKDGSDDEAIIEELADTETDLHKVVVESVNLLDKTHIMATRSDYPFQVLEGMLETIRARYSNTKITPAPEIEA